VRNFLFISVLLSLVACDDAADTLKWEGETGTAVPFTMGSLTPEVTVDMATASTTERFVVDTGSPVNLADVGIYPESAGIYDRDVSALGLRFPELPMIYEDWLPDTAPIAGILGASILINFNWEIDYPNTTITLYDEFPQLDTADAAVTFMLKGGGRYRATDGDILDVGATRHLVWLDIEGERVLALLDTGATYMVVSQSFLNLLGGMDGRPDLGTEEMFTVNGTFDAQVTELSSVAFEDAPDHSLITDVTTTIMPDTFFSELERETGKVVEALLGGSYLSLFRLRFATDEGVIYVSPPVQSKARHPRPTLSRPLRMPPALEVIP